jgi:hypothetical protein
MLLGPDGKPLLGPDGVPLGMERVRIERTDAGVTYSTGKEAVTFDPKQLLMAMARRQRDGASHAAIIAEFELVGEARSPFVLERALAMGRQLLDAAIAKGDEPAETFGERLAVVEDDEDEDVGETIYVTPALADEIRRQSL